MTGTVHTLFPDHGAADERDSASAPPLPIVQYVVDLAVQFERIRAATENALAVLRAAPTATNATHAGLNQIMDAWARASHANETLASILQCKGQA